MSDTKLFRSKFAVFARPFWDKVIGLLSVPVHDKIVECDRQIILGGLWENPAVFTNPIVFFTNDVLFYGKNDFRESQKNYLVNQKKLFVSILKKYYTEMIDVSGMTPAETVERIGEYIETYQP